MCFISHSRKDVLRTYRDSRVTDSSIISVATGQIEKPQVSCAPGPLLVADINSESNVDVIPQSLWRRQTNQGLRRECAKVRVRNLVSSAPISHEARWEAFCALLHGARLSGSNDHVPERIVLYAPTKDSSLPQRAKRRECALHEARHRRGV
jgi:hypothetical protein